MNKIFKLVEGWRRYTQDQYGTMTDPFYGPPPLINDVIDCWAVEGVRFYTDPHHANGMMYHVMLPTEELVFHLEGGQMSKHSYSYMAQDLIQKGYPPRAVRVVVGKNGRAIIDRDREIVFAAQEIGLEELPVMFVFQEEA
jgi:hypothetical protein